MGCIIQLCVVEILILFSTKANFAMNMLDLVDQIHIYTTCKKMTKKTNKPVEIRNNKLFAPYWPHATKKMTYWYEKQIGSSNPNSEAPNLWMFIR